MKWTNSKNSIHLNKFICKCMLGIAEKVGLNGSKAWMYLRGESQNS